MGWGGEGGLTATKFFKGEGKVRKADLIIILKRVGLVVKGGPLFKGGAETPIKSYGHQILFLSLNGPVKIFQV